MRQLIYILLICFINQTSLAQLSISEVVTKNSNILPDWEGDYNDLIELHNTSNGPLQLTDFFISDKAFNPSKWQLPNITLSSGDFIVIQASGKDTVFSEYHSNFKLQQINSETLFVIDGGLNIVDSIALPCIPENHSYTAYNNMYIYDSLPDLGLSNISFGFYTINEDSIIWSHPAGLYNNALNLHVSSNNGNNIKLTTDGTYPKSTQNNFVGSINISESFNAPLSTISTGENWQEPNGTVLKGTVISVQSYNKECPLANKEKRTFIVTDNVNYKYPSVLSLSFESSNLFGEEGIYVPGKTGKNYEQKGINWEREIFLEYFNKTGQQTISAPAGVRIHGGGSRKGIQKSLRIYLRDDYGIDSLSNFSWQDRKDSLYLRRFLIRAGHSDFTKSLIRDHLLSKILEGTSLDYQASEPTIVFMNGEYWGIHFIKERQDDDHISRQYNISKSNINVVENGGVISEGSNLSYIDMMNFARYNNLSETSNYNYISSLLDINNYIDYMIINMYIANWDWPFRNVKFWNSEVDSIKFRGLFFDGDACFYKDSKDFFKDLILKKSEADEDHLLFSALMENHKFQEQFKFRTLNLIDGILNPDRLVQLINEVEKTITPYLPEHIRRWGHPSSLSDWNNSLHDMRFFVQNRPQGFIHDLESKLDLDFNVYPNPTQTELFLPDFDNTSSFEYQVINMRGDIVQSETHYNKQTIDVSYLNHGVYTIRVILNGSALYSKFVKL